jgi:ribonuclease HI
MRHCLMTRQNQAQQLNAIVDNALLAPTDKNREQLRLLSKASTPGPLAERLRRRATLLGKRRGDDRTPLLRLRDELILAVYAAVAPKGWSCGWADGASFKTDGHRQAGIGGLLMDSDGTVIERISRSIGEEDAFAAELAALIAVMQCATERQQKRLWLYTDNRGLVQLWNEHRDDNRLDELRRQATGLERFTLRAIPRLHNQPANALARAAVRACTDPFL